MGGRSRAIACRAAERLVWVLRSGRSLGPGRGGWRGGAIDSNGITLPGNSGAWRGTRGGLRGAGVSVPGAVRAPVPGWTSGSVEPGRAGAGRAADRVARGAAPACSCPHSSQWRWSSAFQDPQCWQRIRSPSSPASGGSLPSQAGVIGLSVEPVRSRARHLLSCP